MDLSILEEHPAFIGTPGSGKTTAAKAYAEELLRLGMRVLIIDVLGVWWGLRKGRDGKSQGFDIPIIGGPHGDMPIDEDGSGGDLIGERIGASDVSAIIDLKDLGQDE